MEDAIDRQQDGVDDMLVSESASAHMQSRSIGSPGDLVYASTDDIVAMQQMRNNRNIGFTPKGEEKDTDNASASAKQKLAFLADALVMSDTAHTPDAEYIDHANAMEDDMKPDVEEMPV